MPTAAARTRLDFGAATIHRNLSTPELIEHAIRRGEGTLAANGALNVDTGDRTGRSPKDKFLEDTPAIHGNIDYTAYEGMVINGKPEVVMSKGKVIIENDGYVGTKGDGAYLKRGLNQYLI